MKRASAAIAIALSTATILTGCAANKDRVPTVTSTGIARPYPPPPADQVKGCGPKPNVEGVQAKIAWARAEKYGEDCAALQRRFLRFYNDLRATKNP